MTTEVDPPGEAGTERDFRSLPPQIRLDKTIESLDPGPVPDPEAGRNVDQDRALRDA